MKRKVGTQPAELANLSAALARIQSTVDRLAWGDGPADEPAGEPAAAAAQSGTDRPGHRLAKALDLKKQKDLRRKLLATKLSLIGDPIWNLLLELYIAQHRRQSLSISVAAGLMAVPSTTALRYIGYCESRGMIEREADPFDRRRVFIRLTGDGERAISDYLDQA